MRLGGAVPAEQLLRGAPQLVLDAHARPPLDREQASFKRVEPPLEPDDIGFTQCRHIDRVGGLVDDGRSGKRQLVALRGAFAARRAGGCR